MTDINNYGKVIFDKETSTTISEILQKYNLDEKPDEIFSKLEKEELLNGDTILTIVEEIVLGIAQEGNLASLVESRLKIPKQTAQELAVDVKEKLLLGARKATKEEIDALESEPENELGSVSESMEKPQEKLNPFVVSPVKPAEPIIPDGPKPRITENQPPIEKKKDDVYREPLN